MDEENDKGGDRSDHSDGYQIISLFS